MLVVDDHDVVHWGFRLMLTQQSWVERCLSAHNGPEALELAVRYRPHVALVDLFIGEESGAEVCERIRAASADHAGAAVLRRGEISPHAARPRARRLCLQGLAGPADRRGGANGRAGRDRVRAPPGARRDGPVRTRASGARADGLGLTNPEIGEALHLSKHTVKEHTSAVYRKLGVRNRTEAVQRAQRLGLLG